MKIFLNDYELDAVWEAWVRVKNLTFVASIAYLWVGLGACADEVGARTQTTDGAPVEQIYDARLIDGPAADDASVVGLEESCEAQIGKPCERDDDCCTPLSCIRISTGLQVCTRGCTRDNLSTEILNEDDCPPHHRCMREGFIVCLPVCTIRADSNECDEGVACHPASTALTGAANKTACSHPACRSGKDCPVMLAGSCQVGNGDCSRLAAGAFCFAADGASQGQCALAGVCDEVTGLCRSHDHGNSAASVGDPCDDDRDCGGQMRCQREVREADGTVLFRNGYCIIEGCTFSKALPDRSCPGGSTCFVLGAGGHCYKSCDPEQSDGCRGQPDDVFGDYECYDWSQYGWNQTLPYSTEPVCDITVRLVYDYFKHPSIGCAALGLKGNPTNMACRDPSTGTTMPSGSTDCRCLDTSSSGPMSP